VEGILICLMALELMEAKSEDLRKRSLPRKRSLLKRRRNN